MITVLKELMWLVLIGIGSIGLLWLVCWTIIAIVITILELLGWKSSKEGGMIAAFRVTIFEILITILELLGWKLCLGVRHLRTSASLLAGPSAAN